jgi:hypothetical protein
LPILIIQFFADGGSVDREQAGAGFTNQGDEYTTQMQPDYSLTNWHVHYSKCI